MDKKRYTDKLQQEASRRIRAGRRAKAMSQQDMSDSLLEFGIKIGPSSYAKMERGERSLSFVEAMALVEILNISLSDLIPQHSDVQDEIIRQMKNIQYQTVNMADAADSLSDEIVSLLAKLEIFEKDIENFADKIVVPGLTETASTLTGEHSSKALSCAIKDLQRLTAALDPIHESVSSFIMRSAEDGFLDRDGRVIPGAGYFNGDD